MGDGDYWFTGHTHVICDVVYRRSDWFDPYEPMPDPSDFRSELLEAVASVGPEGVEWKKYDAP
jgi:hypothetical protein